MSFCGECGYRTESTGYCPNCEERSKQKMNFCGACGKKIESANFCIYCGASFNKQAYHTQQPQPHQTHHFRPYGIGVVYNVYKDYESSLGGWFLFFVVLIVIGCVFGTIMTLIAIAAGENGAALLGTLLTLVSYVLNIVCVVQISRRKSDFLWYNQHAAIINVIGQIIVFLTAMKESWGFALQSSSYQAMVVITVVFYLIFSAAGIALMTLYYCKSIRVRLYMGNDDYAKKALFSFEQPLLYDFRGNGNINVWPPAAAPVNSDPVSKEESAADKEAIYQGIVDRIKAINQFRAYGFDNVAEMIKDACEFNKLFPKLRKLGNYKDSAQMLHELTTPEVHDDKLVCMHCLAEVSHNSECCWRCGIHFG